MKPQFIRTESGEELVVLPRRDYDDLVDGLSREDAAMIGKIARARADVAAGRDIVVPPATAEAIARGMNEIKALREWRGMTQAELAKKAGVTQSYVSQLEAGTSAGTQKALRAIAKALSVPIDLLVPA